MQKKLLISSRVPSCPEALAPKGFWAGASDHGANPGFATENSTKVQVHNECILVQTERPDLATLLTKNAVGKRYKMSEIWYRVRLFGTCNRKVQSEYFLIQALKNLVRE